MTTTIPHLFTADGEVPNNPRLPLLLHRDAFPAGTTPAATAAAIEQRLGANGWPAAWRNGIYAFPHYHSDCHETLAVVTGTASVMFGGRNGVVAALWPDTVAVLPAGTAHQALQTSADLLIVGAYPAGSVCDLQRATAEALRLAPQRIARVPTPASDPVLGLDGGVAVLWR